MFLTQGRYSGATGKGHLGILFESGTHWIDIAAYCGGASAVESGHSATRKQDDFSLETIATLRVIGREGGTFELRIRATSIGRTRQTMRFHFPNTTLELNPFGGEGVIRVIDSDGRAHAKLLPVEPGPTSHLPSLVMNWHAFLTGVAEHRETTASAETSVITTAILEACQRFDDE